ncbi:hypothetical protein I3F58_09500 [Streptomyces sp. MUM 203J]|uniref:hypothetical protein n=1 Tax=Streptomyces sp. MUM 203J TaxID=2791990 RepID=UPI001F03E530|nr:hypothetical protein [Streptomyces sp. MUM 203J]MCH0539794.1 hypothetical protein [Streptomyces sp. MUM 203J]
MNGRAQVTAWFEDARAAVARVGGGRLVLGAAGVAAMGLGASLVVDTGSVMDVILWLAGAVLLHDLVAAPFVLLVGLVVVVRVAAPRLVRGALVVAGGLTLVALPVLLAPRRAARPTVLPLDYPRNWLLLMGAVAVGALLLAVSRAAPRWARAGAARVRAAREARARAHRDRAGRG